MAQATANEQFMLELVNKSRAAAGKQPLAMNSYINTAADLHTDYQLDVNKLTHTGSGGTTAYTRMKNAGYDFNGSSTWGENVGWQSVSGTTSYQDEIVRIHEWLMNSSGHRANLLNGNFREVGIGFDVGSFQGYNSAIATQDFAKANGNAFVTGVTFDDKDGDRSYDVGEGLGTVTVTARNTSTGATFTTSTGTAGGYSLSLAAGTYAVTFAETGYASKTSTVTIGTNNVKLDWIDPATSSSTSDPAPSTGVTITGTSSSETLTGGSGNDVLKGLAGNDTLKAGTGADTMYGGTGSDKFYVDNSGDLITEYTQEGTDTVYSSVDYALRSYVENLTLTGTASNDATGNSYHNSLTGNSGANLLTGLGGNDKLYGKAGNDKLVGGDGADFLQGGSGTDTLSGGAGADKFDWNSTTDVGKGSARDVILDMVRGSDKIDLSGIDANSGTSTNDAFRFIGNDTFNSVRGELRFYDAGTFAVVQGDVNGDRIADFEITVNGTDYLSSTDFVL